MTDEGATPHPDNLDYLDLVTSIVAAYVRRNQIPQTDLPELIKSIHETLAALNVPAVEAAAVVIPAVPVKKSVTKEYIICLEDGAKLKMLKRYLRTHYGLSPDQYRAKWGLASDYPMVAPNYAQARSEMAKRAGFGKIAPATGRGRKRISA